MNITKVNNLSETDLEKELEKCCGSKSWIKKMIEIFPVHDQQTLLANAEVMWYQCNEHDWKEAFDHHPKIGDMNSLQQKFAATSHWAEGEQSAVKQTSLSVLQALAEGNERYEQQFGYIFIVCATGKSAEEMLALMQGRLHNTPVQEIHIAMEEQNKITQLRLQKLLAL